MTEEDSGELEPAGAVLGRNPDTTVDDRVAALGDIIGAFAEATTDYDDLLDTIARKLAEIIGDLCTVHLLSPDGNTLATAAAHDLDLRVLQQANEFLSTTPMAVVPVQQRVLDTGEAYLAPHMSPERARQTTTESRASFTDRIGMHSVLLVALRARGVPLGVINLVRHRPDRPGYDERDRALAQQLADHAAVAIANARLLRARYDQLRLAHESTERANRELEAFSYSVAHDLRGPLRAVGGYSRILIEDYATALDATGLDHLARIQAASQRMTQLIDDLLRLSRTARRPLERTRVDLSALADETLATLAAHQPRGVTTTVERGLIADADEALVRIVLENLIGNAWKFTAKRADASISVGAVHGATSTAVYVRDNGIGFDSAAAKQLFTPFHRLHGEAEFEGTGIGLATVQRIVAHHGGRVWAEARPGEGATFWFTLG